MGIFRMSRVAILGAAASAVLLLTPNAAFAANSGHGVVNGNGTISPALTTTVQPVSGGFTGTAVGAGVIGTSEVTINDSCTFSFASSGAGDDIATGQGSASGSCSGTASISASLSYTRVGGAVSLMGSGSINGTAVSLTVTCSFEATSAPNVSTFDLQCHVLVS